jgi:homoprotocatechuate degradation regulator HpaR
MMRIVQQQNALPSREPDDLPTSRTIPYRNLPQLLLRGREELLRHFRPLINHFGLTEQQWRILRAIDQAGQLEPRQICEICQILSPSLTGVLARMEQLDLVARTRMEKDQRRVIVRLTPKAQKLVAQLAPLVVEQYGILEKAYGRELITELYAVMDRLLTADHAEVRQVALPRKARRK